MPSCHALCDGNLFWWAMHQTASSTGAKIIVSCIPLQRSLFRNNSHSFSCEAVWLLWTFSAPCLYNRNYHKVFFFPKNTSFYRTTCLNCVERASYDCGGITGKTNRASLSPPCTQSPEAHKTSLSKLTQCDSKFYIQISWQLRWIKM